MRLVARRQPHDELVCVGRTRSLLDLVLARARASDPDVVQDRGVEQERVLLHH